MKGFAKKFCFLLLVICLTLCSTGLAAGTGERVPNVTNLKKGNPNKTIRIALCHLDVAQGPQEKNIQKIEKAIHIAGGHGANWIVTPETALQGYYFYVIDPGQKDKIKAQPSEDIRSLTEACKKYDAYLFLGAGAYDKQADNYRNTCLIFGPDGKPVGRHNKMSAHVGFGAERWSTNDYILKPVTCSDVTTGVLVCSDIWFLNYPRVLADKGAQIIIDIAAWPPAPQKKQAIRCRAGNSPHAARTCR